TVPFGIVSGSPYSVPAGQTGLVVVSFTPATAGAFSNALVFLSNGGNSTNSIKGVGLTPGQLAISPLALDFGTIAVGSNTQASFVMSNSGGAPITNVTAALSDAAFTITSPTTFHV